MVSTGASILLMGPPGVGKTTAIREVSRMLADEYNKRVVIVDTSNEIGGDGDIPHPGIGRARRMQVPSPELQHHVSGLSFARRSHFLFLGLRDGASPCVSRFRSAISGRTVVQTIGGAGRIVGLLRGWHQVSKTVSVLSPARRHTVIESLVENVNGRADPVKPPYTNRPVAELQNLRSRKHLQSESTAYPTASRY